MQQIFMKVFLADGISTVIRCFYYCEYEIQAENYELKSIKISQQDSTVASIKRIYLIKNDRLIDLNPQFISFYQIGGIKIHLNRKRREKYIGE